MTLYLTDRTEPAEIDARQASGCVHGLQALSGRRDHAFRAGVTDIRKHRCGARAHERARHAAAGARRSDRPGGRRVRSRGALHRRGARAAGERLSAAAHRVRAHHDRARGASSCRRARRRRRDHHAAASAAQPQRAVRRRHPSASLLPAGAQDRAPTARRCSRRSPAATRASSSAPTARRTRAHTKESACGCAGMFSAHAGIELYAEAFEAAGALRQARGVRRDFGADFYGLPRNTGTHHAASRNLAGAGQLSLRRPTSSCRCAPAKASPGDWPARRRHEHARRRPRPARRPQRPPRRSWPALPRFPAGGHRRGDRRLQLRHRCAAGDRRGADRHGRRRHAAARRDAQLSRAALRGRAARSGVARRHGHRSVSSAAPGDAGAGCAAAHIPRDPPRDARLRLPARHPGRATTPRSIWAFSTPRWRAPRSSAIRFIRSRASTPRRSPAPRSARRCWPRRWRWPAWSGMRAARTRPPTTPSARADIFCLVCNACATATRRPRSARARWGGSSGAAEPDELADRAAATGT